jgi:integrase
MADKKSKWERTSVQNLIRDRLSGRYYGRFVVSRKQKWVSLKTDVFSVAKLRLNAEAAKIAGLRQSRAAVVSGDATVGDLMRIYEERTKVNSELRQSSIESRMVALKKVQKTWPGIEQLPPKSITPSAIFDWAARFKKEGTGYVAPGATKAVRGNSATSVNRAIDTLRRVMDIAVQRGQIHTNPVSVKPTDGRLKKKVVQKRLVLPSVNEVEQLFLAIENNGAVGGWGAEAADLCRFLTYSGCRIGEVPLLTWRHVDNVRNVLHIPGEKTATSDRSIPLFPALKALLDRLKTRREKAAQFSADGRAPLGMNDPIFRLKECQKSIDSACRRVGVQRVTHHDFRHLFATICIESGVDIPTVSRWLGHSDGGVLAMRTYGHLRQDHSQEAALKVNFGGR